MKVVSSNSEADLARERARQEAEWAIVELTANLLRIVRGAGKPYELRQQIRAVDEAMQAHWDAAKMWPYPEMAAALQLSDPWKWVGKVSDDESERLFAVHSIIRGALQMAASELLEQRTQEAAGRSELFDGVNRIERLREERRREERLRQMAARTSVTRKKARPKSAKRPVKKPPS